MSSGCLGYSVRNSSQGTTTKFCFFFYNFSPILNIYFISYYTTNMMGIQVDGMVLDEIIKSRLPRLSQYLATLKTPIALISAQWLLPIFSNHFPSETTFRILDCILCCERGSEIPFAIILAHLRLHSHSLMQCNDFLQVSQTLRQVESELFDVDYLMDIAFSEMNSLEENISLLRKKFTSLQAAELRKRGKANMVENIIGYKNCIKRNDDIDYALLLNELIEKINQFCQGNVCLNEEHFAEV